MLTQLSLGPGPGRRGLNSTWGPLYLNRFCHSWSCLPVFLTEFSPFSLGTTVQSAAHHVEQASQASEQLCFLQFMNAPFVVWSTTVRYNWSCSPLCLWPVSISGDGFLPNPCFFFFPQGPSFYFKSYFVHTRISLTQFAFFKYVIFRNKVLVC